jgi:hypothetical protein
MLSKSQRAAGLLRFCAPRLRSQQTDGNLVDGPRPVAGAADNDVDALIPMRSLSSLENLSSLAKVACSAVSV